ncbi:hypothetical protein DQQ10_24300 [Pseudochryseolinea flava]|uniref:Uncharacterized protein n=2 Tax=Pseudochryseolinea flava TaxID=2059302 RepID=A0A364XVU6_9BACT|nr:hypothetical protein DQQ10_24300 [Pseudochryseolinea flava]
MSPWDLVPASSVFVYETNDCKSCVEQLQQTSMWSILRKAAFYEKPADSLSTIFDVLNANRTGKLISAHTTRKDDFDFIFYIPAGKSAAVPEAWSKLKVSEREFNGIKIYELSLHKQIFSWSLIDQVWVGSFTPFLIEDVIRTYAADDGSPFKNDIAAAYQLAPVKSDAGNLYVNIKKFGQWLSSFTTESPDLIKYLGQSSLLDIKSTPESLVLNGLSLDSADQRFLLSIFTNQVPVPFNLKTVVSNRSVMFMSYGISDGTKFGDALQKFAARKKPKFKDSIAYVNNMTGVKVENLYSSIGKEIGVCFLESKDETLSKVLLLETSNGDQWIQSLNTIAEKTSVDTIFAETYSDYEIREVPVVNFAEKILWPLVTDFPNCFYTRTGNIIVMAQNLDELKEFLDDIDQENTWGKSVAQNKFLESTLLEANISLYLNTPMAWNILTHSLHPKWARFVKEHQESLDALGMGAVQLSHLNNSYYTNAIWSFDESASAAVTNDKNDKKDNKDRNKTNKYLTNFSESISRFFVVQNHSTKKDDVFIQDSSNTVSLVGDDGKVLWSVDVNKPIQGDISQIDYFNNGKLQVLFATAGQLHLIDRLGNYVSPFPLTIKENDPDFLSIVDYDHSKKYRFLISGKSGKLWMHDKGGENLEGWQPKAVGGKLSTAAHHHRIRGKDYLIAVREDGTALLMNRRGETLKNFPLNLDARFSGDYYLETGNSTATTSFVVVSRDGLRIKFNLEGKILSRESLIKTSPDAVFKLIRDKNDRNYVIVRQDSRRLTVLDENLHEVLSADFIGNNAVDVKLYTFGGGKEYITLTDKTQDLSFVYDTKGNLLTNVPIESRSIIVRPSRTDKPKVFAIEGKSLSIMPL